MQAISQHVPLHPIRTEQEYEAAVSSMNRLLDAGAADEVHPLADLVATLGELIGDYDAAHYPAHPLLRGKCFVRSWISMASRRASWHKN